MKPLSRATASYRLTGALVISGTLLLLTNGCDKKSEPQKAAPVVQQTHPVPKVAEPTPATTATSAAKFEGKYLNKKYSHDFIELRKDGTFTYQEGNIKQAGKFSTQGTRLMLALPDGSGSISTIDDTGITDGQGEVWKR